MTTRNKKIEERVLNEAWCLYENELTIREVAKRFGVSKTTVYNDLTIILPKITNQLYKAVEEVLRKNKAESHVRGGEAMKKKYESLRK